MKTYSVKITCGKTLLVDEGGKTGTALLDGDEHNREMTAEQVWKVLLRYGQAEGQETLTVEAVERGLELGHTMIYMDSATGSIGLVSLESLVVQPPPGQVQ